MTDLTVYFTGTAGAGKSTMVAAYDRWCKQHGLTTTTVNLDPGAEQLPYEPDIDIRHRIRISDIMAEHGLGPNGAQIAAADMIALDLEDLKEELGALRSDQIIVDTPGQMELFVFRAAGKHIVEELSPGNSVVAYLLDPFLARSATGFASQFMFAAITQMRLAAPMAYIMTKADRVEPETADLVAQWARDVDSLEADVLQDAPGMDRELATQITRMLGGMGIEQGLLTTSAIENEGLDDIYAHIQSVAGQSEDSTPEYDTFRGPQEDEM